MTKIRIDQYLVEEGFFPSRQRAQAALMAGEVKLKNQIIDKAGTKFKPEDLKEISVASGNKFASRGGLKLEKALEAFSPEVENKSFLDIGASTGGFTDCLLKNGANFVYSIDVGYGQLVWELRSNEKVKVMERCNARHLQKEELYKDKTPLASAAVIDVSFISLKKIIPNLLNLLDPLDYILALIKPQFEVGKNQVGKGVVRDPKLHLQTLVELNQFFNEVDLEIEQLTYSPVKGPAGNIEFLVLLRKQKNKPELNFEEIVAQAHKNLNSED